MVELFTLAGDEAKRDLYQQRLDITRAAFTLLLTDEGYFVKSIETDGTRHGVLGQERYGYLEGVANADALAIIDSDPGGYPGSTNADLIRLLARHRKLLDRLRPGIELIYWMHFGWEAYSRHYADGRSYRGTDEEHSEMLRRLRTLNPEPWGLANGLPYAEKLGLAGKVTAFNYGRIEREPSFPLTAFTPERAHSAGSLPAARGVMGNAQTHCVQLPNIFAFAQGARGRSVAREEFTRFAEDLIPGIGQAIVQAWEALGSANSTALLSAAQRLQSLRGKTFIAGPLKGLLFGDPDRFMDDLQAMVELKAAGQGFIDRPSRNRLSPLVTALKKWQQRTGYMNRFAWPELEAALLKFEPRLASVFNPELKAATPFQRVAESFALVETETPRLLEALETIQ
jgi:hypothetical protein